MGVRMRLQWFHFSRATVISFKNFEMGYISYPGSKFVSLEWFENLKVFCVIAKEELSLYKTDFQVYLKLTSTLPEAKI